MAYSLALQIINDAGVAEEILQDVFYQLWRLTPDLYFGSSSATGWLLNTARDRALDRLRHRKPAESYHLQEIPFAFDVEPRAAQAQMSAKVRRVLSNLS